MLAVCNGASKSLFTPKITHDKRSTLTSCYGQQMVQKLFTICEITETASEDEAEVAILNTELFKFSFDTQSHKVIDIDRIHI